MCGLLGECDSTRGDPLSVVRGIGGRVRRRGVPRVLAGSPPQQGTVIWGEYDGALRSAVLGLKHRGHDELAKPLGRRLAGRVAAESWASDIDLVVHVPSHPSEIALRPIRGGLPRGRGRERARPASGTCFGPEGRRRQTGRTRRNGCSSLAAASAAPLPCRQAAADRRRRHHDRATLRRAAEVLGEAGAEVVYCAALAHTPDPRKAT